MNKKGDLGKIFWQIMMVLIIFLMFGVAIVGYWAYSMFAPVTVDLIDNTTGIINDAFINDTGEGNLSEAVSTSTSMVSAITGSVEFFSYLMLIALIIGFIIIFVFVDGHPMLFPFWIFMVIGLVLISVFLSNAYSDFSTGNDDISQAYQNWADNNFVMNYLPFIVGTLGLFGGALLFIRLPQKSEILTGGIE